MSETLSEMVAEALRTGTIEGLPNRLFINGQWCTSASGEELHTFDPGTGCSFAVVPSGDAEDIDRAVEAAYAAQHGTWRRTTPAERSRILYRAAAALRENADRFAVVESLDSGKKLSEAQGDVRTAVRTLEYYAGAADKLHGDTIPLGHDYVSFTLLEPVGVTAHIVPWNYPLSTTVRGVAPALAAGCTAVVKPAEQTPLTALMFADVLRQAGLPDGVYNVVTGTGPRAGQPLVSHEKVDHVTFTGSVDTGVGVMQAAAPNITAVTLELGGKSPMIVLADADLDVAAEATRGAIFENAGQVCSAGSRLIVERSIHDQLLDRISKIAAGLVHGHGLGNPDIGAINSREQLDKIAGYVGDAQARGLSIATGGAITVDPLSGEGWFFEPTIIDNVTPQDVIAQEEIFGPVLCVQVAEDVEEAFDLANGTRFGLVAGIYTRDIDKALQFSREIDAGQVFINEYDAGGIETPFGGTRHSGFGRAKGMEGVNAYTRTKTVTARIREVTV